MWLQPLAAESRCFDLGIFNGTTTSSSKAAQNSSSSSNSYFLYPLSASYLCNLKATHQVPERGGWGGLAGP
ncbi:hypothetical protein V497_00044 [Pseudogymnoascus sp. VKM F-4516 (FW-969)]|nr:hypothetical protein V497_00044 [Pseudogymnoascus sp. VKM F-4516 (FW-969)]